MTEPDAPEMVYLISYASLSAATPRDIEVIRAGAGSLARGWQLSSSKLQELGANPELGVGRRKGRSIAYALDALRLAEANAIHVVDYWNEAYPRGLRRLAKPPLCVYLRGEIRELDRHVAMVGTREPTDFGRAATRQIAGELVHKGYTIVSGLARGIDTASHEATLAAGGRTIAVLPTGHLAVYPSENISLADQIGRQGAVISEYPPAFGAREWSFRNRNRIIAALSESVVVVEAREHSGAFITVRYARDLDIPIFAVIPLDSTSPQSFGPSQLISSGVALPVSSGDQIANANSGERVGTADSADGRVRDAPADALPRTEHQFAGLILDAISDYLRTNGIDWKRLSRTKLEKWAHAVTESLELPITRSWYLRGCYLDDEALTLSALSEHLESPRTLAGPLAQDIRREVEAVAANTGIFRTSDMEYLRTLYETKAPVEFRDVYLANLSLMSDLADLQRHVGGLRSGRHSPGLGRWTETGLSIGPRVYRHSTDLVGALAKDERFDRVFEVFRGYAALLSAVCDSVDSGLAPSPPVSAPLAETVNELAKSYYTSVWRMPASIISQCTARGPRADNLARQMSRAESDLTVEMSSEYATWVHRFLRYRDSTVLASH